MSNVVSILSAPSASTPSTAAAPISDLGEGFKAALADASKRPILAGGKAVSDESKSDESKIGAVLANAPAIKKAFGPLGR